MNTDAEELAELREDHADNTWNGHPWCYRCNTIAPCSVCSLLDLLEAEQQRAQRLQGLAFQLITETPGMDTRRVEAAAGRAVDMQERLEAAEARSARYEAALRKLANGEWWNERGEAQYPADITLEALADQPGTEG